MRANEIIIYSLLIIEVIFLNIMFFKMVKIIESHGLKASYWFNYFLTVKNFVKVINSSERPLKQRYKSYFLLFILLSLIFLFTIFIHFTNLQSDEYGLLL